MHACADVYLSLNFTHNPMRAHNLCRLTASTPRQSTVMIKTAPLESFMVLKKLNVVLMRELIRRNKNHKYKYYMNNNSKAHLLCR
jgi:hypothetical protein